MIPTSLLRCEKILCEIGRPPGDAEDDFYFFPQKSGSRIRGLRSVMTTLKPARLYCIRQQGITNGTTETATMAAEYRGIFPAARLVALGSSERQRAQGEFIRSPRRRTSASPARREIWGAQFRLDLSDIGSPLGTIAMIAEISWRARYGIQCFPLAQNLRERARSAATVRAGVQFNARKRRSVLHSRQPAGHEEGRVASAFRMAYGLRRQLRLPLCNIGACTSNANTILPPLNHFNSRRGRHLASAAFPRGRVLSLENWMTSGEVPKIEWPTKAPLKTTLSKREVSRV